MTYGGKRQGAGRKALTPEQKEQKAAEKRQQLIDELLFPAVCSALHAEPGVWKNGYLQVQLSKTDIKLAYGADGLKEWCSYFTLKKIGGKDRFGVGYKSKWEFNINKYSMFVKFADSLGHKIKEIPRVGFPPAAMLDRLDAIKQKAQKRKVSKAEGQPKLKTGVTQP
jgi:hypothetical protein